ncbi:MAG: hypothetical protein AB4042_17020 [Leptolyngbyaceae cyanobacterium]
MAPIQSGQQNRQLCYGAIALLSMSTLWGLGFTTELALAQSTEAMECLCESVSGDENFQCLVAQGSRLNRAKNLARQRGEIENGGISIIEIEPSMHGPAQESPYSLARVEGSVRYIFTFRVRPRATQDYTHESQVAVDYAVENDEWTVETLYNRAIAPTATSYLEEMIAAQSDDLTCDILVPHVD